MRPSETQENPLELWFGWSLWRTICLLIYNESKRSRESEQVTLTQISLMWYHQVTHLSIFSPFFWIGTRWSGPASRCGATRTSRPKCGASAVSSNWMFSFSTSAASSANRCRTATWRSVGPRYDSIEPGETRYSSVNHCKTLFDSVIRSKKRWNRCTSHHENLATFCETLLITIKPTSSRNNEGCRSWTRFWKMQTNLT